MGHSSPPKNPNPEARSLSDTDLPLPSFLSIKRWCAGLNNVLPKIHVYLEPVDVTLFGNGVFIDEIKLRGGRNGLGWAINPV